MAKRKSEGEIRLMYHVERVTSAKKTYEVDVAGTRDPENCAIVIENLGDGYLVHPRIRANDQSDWFDKKTIVADALRGLGTDEEKAIALTYLFDGTRYQRTNVDHLACNPVVLLGVYGYGICGHTAPALMALATAAGLKARFWELNHHTVSELFFDGAWHMLDGNLPGFYLKRDNRTLASIAELEDDPDLVARTHPRGKPTHAEWHNWYSTKEYHFRHHGSDDAAFAERDLGVTLKPFERFERYWKPTHKYHDMFREPAAPKRYANGRFVFQPDLATTDPHRLAKEGHVWVKNLKWVKGGQPALVVDRPWDKVYDQPARFIVHVRTPYAIVGGKLRFCALRRGTGEHDVVAVQLRQYFPGAEGALLYKAMGEGAIEVELDLGRAINPVGPIGRYDYELCMSLGADPAGCTGLNEYELETDVQVAPLALPALRRGKNVVQYSDASGRSRDARIIHVWRERVGGEAPLAPTRLSPDGKTVDSLAPRLEWKQPEGTDEIVDYQIIVSRWPHCRIPHCPDLYGPAGSNATYLDVAPGWLNRSSKYWWKVRAKDRTGDWGPWSRIASFRT
jgi:hypothetical protein